MRLKYFTYLLCLVVFISSCRKEPQPLPQEETRVTADPNAVVKGFYLVNEGNMNMNKASLDYLDLVTGVYKKNFYC